MGQGAIIVDVLQDEPLPELHLVVTHLDNLQLYRPNTVISHLYPGSVVVSPQRGWNTTLYGMLTEQTCVSGMLSSHRCNQ